jgi:dihydrofolate reductase
MADRALVLKMDVSLDGFVATRSGDVSWIFETFDDDLRAWIVGGLWRAGTHVMGRATYEGMAAHWPTSTEPYAAPMNEIPKVVFSRTLEDPSWGPTRVARGDLAEEVARLKAEPGDEILAHGGARFAQSLTRLGLVDQLRLIVHPVALGAGLSLFGTPMHLDVAETMTFDTGVVALTCTPRTGELVGDGRG